MPERTVQLVLHYDGSGFAGWQRQPNERTVQAVLEDALARLCGSGGPVAALGSGRTDAGVHARGQAVGVRLPPRWVEGSGLRDLRRALNALLPKDVWVAAAYEMAPSFHARYSAISRRYSYYVGTDDAAHSPFRRRWEWAVARELDRSVLDASADALLGEHCFRAFAVQGTAPASDRHCCTILDAAWRDRPGGLVFEIEANRFLHHMVRFLLGTMIDAAAGRRASDSIAMLLSAADNRETSAPAPPQGLFLDLVRYPRDLYLTPE